MRDRVHVDLSEDDLAQFATIQNLLQHAHRLVVAHVLIDRDRLACSRRLVAKTNGFAERKRERLLGENSLDMLLLQREPDQRRLLVGRVGQIDNLDLGVLDQRLRRRVNLGDRPARRNLVGARFGARGDCRDLEACLPVGGEMALGHDHSGADCADAELPAADRRIRDEIDALRFLHLAFSIAEAATATPCPSERQENAARRAASIAMSSPAARPAGPANPGRSWPSFALSRPRGQASRTRRQYASAHRRATPAPCLMAEFDRARGLRRLGAG